MFECLRVDELQALDFEGFKSLKIFDLPVCYEITPRPMPYPQNSNGFPMTRRLNLRFNQFAMVAVSPVILLPGNYAFFTKIATGRASVTNSGVLHNRRSARSHCFITTMVIKICCRITGVNGIYFKAEVF